MRRNAVGLTVALALGLLAGKSLLLEQRLIEGKNEPIPGLVDELVRLPVDVLVTSGTRAAHAATQATTAIPIVFVAVSDPVGTRHVAGLARPGGTLREWSTYLSSSAGRCWNCSRRRCRGPARSPSSMFRPLPSSSA